MAKSHEKIALNNSEIETVLAKDVHFKGILKFQKKLKIKGVFEGEIKAPEGYLLIDENAVVKANIDANRVTNSGQLVGNAKIKNLFEINKNAKFIGDITTKELIIQQGGILEGHCKMNND